jgi:hypothetical protein
VTGSAKYKFNFIILKMKSDVEVSKKARKDSQVNRSTIKSSSKMTLRRIAETEDLEEIIELTRSEDSF